MQHCLNASDSAGGMDGWAPCDFKLLNRTSFFWVVQMLNAIEKGAPWPKGLLAARVAFLAKDPDECDDPLA